MNELAPLGKPDPLRCGCDDARGLPVDVALARGLAALPRMRGVEDLPLSLATGRVLAHRVCCPQPLPPFDNAAMDGYAIAGSSLPGAGPWVLPVSGRVRAGDAPGRLQPGTACRILTGAPLPAGADTVVAQEAVRVQGGRVILAFRPRSGAHIRRAGEDIAQGAEILGAGRVIGSREAAALASAGCAGVAVHPRVRVTLLATGSELVEPGAPLAPGQIWNSNRYQLAAALAQPWIALTDREALPDTPDALLQFFGQTAAHAELIVTTGGVSVGDEDHMRALFQQAGGTILASDLAMKPGKPVTLGRLGQALWLGLPGNPVAAHVGWMVLGAPLAQVMAGLSEPGPRKIVARLAETVEHRPGRCEYRLARLLGHDARGALQVRCLPAPGSHRVAQMAQADGLVALPADAEVLAADALVDFLPF
ncbi:MAG: molybdopterin molybdotransferase [Rhodobacteraceae bacterium HLUCCA12]|nr:MAG: molybdopterin molybdotransferase [Rhodobacteraceae bacterium HLUCCA12]